MATRRRAPAARRLEAVTAGILRDGPSLDPAAEAHAVGLHYVSDDRPGIVRRRSGKGFSYHDPDGRLIRDRSVRARIGALAIPPAWRQVWICPDPDGHIQATGRDARGRKQYRYHPAWRALRDATKFERMLAFGTALPSVRSGVDEELALPGLSRAKVLAAVLRLIDAALLRVGNEEYARLYDSFGATTMRDEHVVVAGQQMTFSFSGKHGKEQSGRLSDRRLARVVARCQELPGERLFVYVDELGVQREVGSQDVNDHLRELAGQEFSVKDFRTWGGSALATGLLAEVGPPRSERQATERINLVIRIVARDLGNTPAVCRSSYLHPAVLEAYREGSLPEPARIEAPGRTAGLSEAEDVLLAVIGSG